MKGDFSRDSFDPRKPTTRVLRLQGAVDLDSDWNEQVASLLHYNRGLARDLIGWHGSFDNGFRVQNHPDGNRKVQIAKGSYFIDGIRCDLAEDANFDLDAVFAGRTDQAKPCLIYLDVWERFYTSLEDESIREIALAGLDTSARAKIVYKVRAFVLTDNQRHRTREELDAILTSESGVLHPGGARPKLRAWVEPPPDDTSKTPCEALANFGYRRPENQLYRVEIHQKDRSNTTVTWSFKWSRDNGAILYAVNKISVTQTQTVPGEKKRFSVKATLDDSRGTRGIPLDKDDWVELQTDDVAENATIPLLLRVARVDREHVYFNEVHADLANYKYLHAGENTLAHPYLRRWDYRNVEAGAVALKVVSGEPIELEEGVFVEFQNLSDYQPGDYWLIPARTITRDIIWPKGPDSAPGTNQTAPTAKERAAWVEAQRIEHYYAPLAMVNLGATAADRPVINELFGRRQLSGLSLQGIDPEEARTLLREVRGKLNRAKYVDRLVSAQIARKVSGQIAIESARPVSTRVLPFLLQPEDLEAVPPSSELHDDLANSPLSVGEIGRLTSSEWGRLLEKVREKTRPANPALPPSSSYPHVRVFEDAVLVCNYLNSWPTTTLSEDDIKFLATP